MNWFLKLLKKMFCCAKLDDTEDIHLLKNNSISSSDSFPIYLIYVDKHSSFSSISIAN